MFYLPNDVGEEINSTYAKVSIQDGAIVPSLAYPSVSADTFIDTGNIYTNQGSSTMLYVGRGSCIHQQRQLAFCFVDQHGL